MTLTASKIKMTMVPINVVLKGYRPIMFDRYPGSNQIQLDWHDKIYLVPGMDVLALPAINIISFLSAQNSISAPKRTLPAKTYKRIAQGCQSSVLIESGLEGAPDYIPFLKDGEVVKVGAFETDRDPASGIYKAFHVARLKDGIPNPKERPVLPLPWELRFKLTYLENDDVSIPELHALFVKGGMTLGLGTYRGCYGKFEVAEWTEK